MSVFQWRWDWFSLKLAVLLKIDRYSSCNCAKLANFEDIWTCAGGGVFCGQSVVCQQIHRSGAKCDLTVSAFLEKYLLMQYRKGKYLLIQYSKGASASSPSPSHLRLHHGTPWIFIVVWHCIELKPWLLILQYCNTYCSTCSVLQ